MPTLRSNSQAQGQGQSSIGKGLPSILRRQVSGNAVGSGSGAAASAGSSRSASHSGAGAGSATNTPTKADTLAPTDTPTSSRATRSGSVYALLPAQPTPQRQRQGPPSPLALQSQQQQTGSPQTRVSGSHQRPLAQVNPEAGMGLALTTETAIGADQAAHAPAAPSQHKRSASASAIAAPPLVVTTTDGQMITPKLDSSRSQFTSTSQSAAPTATSASNSPKAKHGAAGAPLSPPGVPPRSPARASTSPRKALSPVATAGAGTSASAAAAVRTPSPAPPLDPTQLPPVGDVALGADLAADGSAPRRLEARTPTPTPELPPILRVTADPADPAATAAELEAMEDMFMESSSTPPIERSQEELEKITDEIEQLESSIKELSQSYEIVDKLGEGTFSTVYKAIDRLHDEYSNKWWRQKTMSPKEKMEAALGKKPKRVYVALKRIYVTSSPPRIFNELELMCKMRKHDNVAFLITAWRCEDQIMAVMPYSRHQDFREYYRKIPLHDLKFYFRCMFRALAAVHSERIMHRDVKPANFLYDPTTGHGTLCDFGLAEMFEPSEWRGRCHHICPTPKDPHGQTLINKNVYSIHLMPGAPLGPQKPASSKHKTAMAPPERVGYLKDDPRPAVRSNRAGTRGFRAPEVLLKCQDQTVSIDVWSAGVILLAFLTKRFPMFNANDDNEALLEIACMFGKKRMEQVAMLHNRTFKCNILSVEDAKTHRIPEYIRLLNPSLWDTTDQPNPEKYLREVDLAVDLCRECLHLDCTRRLPAATLLQHPFLAEEDPFEQMHDSH